MRATRIVTTTTSIYTTSINSLVLLWLLSANESLARLRESCYLTGMFWSLRSSKLASAYAGEGQVGS
jgi:hypothetical protein